MTTSETVRPAPSSVPQTSTFNFPAFLAYASAALFIGASVVTNAVYGFAKGHDLPSALTWCAVSVAASIIFALSWPALCASNGVKRSALIACAMLVTGSYSVVGALGSAAGGRTDAASIEAHATLERTRLTAAHDTATKNLAAMPASPAPVPQIAAVAALRATPGANECKVINGPISRETCAKVAALEAEIPAATAAAAREHAKRRADLEGQITETSKGLAAIKPQRQANSDAAAVTEYLKALGMPVSVDVLNRLLALLAVMLIECGGGLSLAVAGALARPAIIVPQDSRVAPATNKAPQPHAIMLPGSVQPEHIDQHTERVDHRGTAPSVHSEQQTGIKNRSEPTDTDVLAGVQGANSDARGRVLAFVHQAGGSVLTTQRKLASAVGVSTSRVNAVLADLSGAGVLSVRVGATGTTLTMAVSANALQT